MPITPQSTSKFTPPADEATPFTNTLAVTDTAEDLVLVPVTKKGRVLSLINDGPGAVVLAFDATAVVATGLLIREGEAYSDEGLEIDTKVSFINAVTGDTPVVRGVLWSGLPST